VVAVGKSTNQTDVVKDKTPVSESQGTVNNRERQTNNTTPESRRRSRQPKKPKKRKTSEMEQGEKSFDKGTQQVASAKDDVYFNDETKIDSVSDAKSRFLNLSVEGRAKSASIFDKTFIGTFLELAGALSIPTNGPSLDITKKVNFQESFKINHSKFSSFQSSVKRCIDITEPDGTDKLIERQHSAASYAKNAPVANTLCEFAREKNESTTTNIRTDKKSQEEVHSISSSPKSKSDVFRIKESLDTRKATTSKGTVDDLKLSERDDQSIITTLHFKSGLSLPVSTKSQSNMKVIANASKCDDKRSVTSIPSRKTSSNSVNDESNEVHKHVNFDALNNLRPDSNQRGKETCSQIISNSKHSAAQAMMSSPILTASMRFMNNIRVVYRGASNFSHIDSENQKLGTILKESDDIIVTFDPSYLSEQSGMMFLDDLERIIMSELRKSSTDGSFIFLHNEFGREEDTTNSLPAALKPIIESGNPEISLLLILAARVEDSIRNSYGSKTQRHDTCDSLLSDIFSSYKYLEGKFMLKTTISLPALQIDSIQLQDLLFVPLGKITLALTSGVDSVIFNGDKLDQLIAKWNHIINSSCQLVFPRGDLSILVTDEDVVELFADDVLMYKPTNSKKKKKSKKKRKSNSHKKTSKMPSKGDDLNEVASLFSAKEDMAEIVNTESVSHPPNDCSESIASTVSASTEVSKRQHVVSELTASDNSRIEAKANSSVSKINGVQGVISIGRTECRGHDINEEGWETVESKKNRDKKTSNQVKGSTEKSGNSGRKNKSKGKNRNRNRQRKTDSSEIDALKKGSTLVKVPIEDRTRRENLKNETHDDNVRQSVGNRATQRISSAGDTTYGSLFKPKTHTQSQETLKNLSVSKTNRSNSASGNVEILISKSSPSRKKKSVADQNTASTVQETVSATSRSYANIDESSNLQQNSKLLTSISTNEAAINMTEVREQSSGSSTLDETSRSMTPSTRKSSAPPLQTLVGPGNINSANSSVASSLEAPHATRHGSHKHKSSKEDDVGYHLLKVCERLSEDINMFMNRRALALSSRRRERSALLASLQETVQSIWAGRCHVEMYGSCATKLDLPSSDLDVVVCGLDRMEGVGKGNQSFVDDISESSSSPSSAHSHNRGYHHHFYPHLSTNGHRVIRLATELEKVPWAVQVKAIPTASVPVIKILADSSRLPGAAGMDWMLQQQRMAAAVIAAAEFNSGKMPNTYGSLHNGDHSSAHHQKGVNNMPASNYSMSSHMAAALSGIPPSPSSSYHSAMPPWRGADVMNGLLSLDITFEGPEHGGLGSTAFSARVIQEACKETGLPPERTPAVQVLMVIKELLAQRKLNEPFSGGLSSYAILLLVVAVVKERRIINREIERIEKQRQAVERSSVNSDSLEGTKSSTWPYEKQLKSLNGADKECTGYSWASVAKKSSSNLTQDAGQEETVDDVSSNKSYQATTSNFTKSDMPTHSKSPQNYADGTVQDLSLFPQGSNDVLEVLCSGEPTAGKLLMHFLLFYGRHFDAYATCIDVSGTHHPDFKTKQDSNMQSNTHISPFTVRKAGGTINPVTEVYTVDPIVVYDPLEGSESNNVARSCYAWENIRWTFEQCYNTLSGVVELGAGSNNNRSRSKTWPQQDSTGPTVYGVETSRNVDDLSPLLELLLSF